MMPTPALPNACGAGLNAANASVLNQRSIVRSDVGQLGIADEVRPRAALAAEVEHGRPAERRRQREAALQHVDAGELPAAEHEVGRLVPVAAESAAAAERQLPDVARDEAVLDVELGRAALGAEVVAVLRLAERAGVDAGAAAARRDVIRRVGQRLAPGVADERRSSPSRTASPGAPAASCSPTSTRFSIHWMSPNAGYGRAPADCEPSAFWITARWFRLRKPGSFVPLLPTYATSSDQVRHQLVLRRRRCTAGWTACADSDPARAACTVGASDVRIEQAGRVAVAQPERRRRRHRRRSGDAGLQQVVDEVRRVEAEHPFAPLPDRVAVEHAVAAAHDPSRRTAYRRSRRAARSCCGRDESARARTMPPSFAKIIVPGRRDRSWRAGCSSRAAASRTRSAARGSASASA